MEHLYLIPKSGLCNRLRAISSARRACEMLGSELSIVWDWGRWEDLFAPLEGVNILASRRAVPASVPMLTTKLHKDGGDIYNQNLPVSGGPMALETGHAFSFQGLPEMNKEELADWIPAPSLLVEGRLSYFQEQLPSEMVGVHIRRTDHKASIKESPDLLFEQEMRALVKDGHLLFLATDNRKTRDHYRGLFPDSIFTLTHQRDLENRWPVRERVACDVEDDYVDLLMLSKCEWVIGSWFSSFSGTAIAMNRDPRCKILKLDS